MKLRKNHTELVLIMEFYTQKVMFCILGIHTFGFLSSGDPKHEQKDKRDILFILSETAYVLQIFMLAHHV